MPILVIVLACSSTQHADVRSTTVRYGLVCPTRNEAAMRAFNRAQDAERERDIGRAETLYRQAVQSDERYCDAMDNLGLLLRRQGKVDEAISWYRQSLVVQPRNHVARANLAMALRLKGKVDESLSEYATLLEQNPDDAEAHYGLALTYLTKQEPRKALEHAERAEKLYWVQRPELMADATLLKGITQWQLRDCRAAVTTLEPIEDVKGSEPDLPYILGACAVDEHRDELRRGVPEGAPWLERARAYLRRARSAGKKIDPEMAQALRL
jgi:tetratricopeptide (TPR) repeat protein